MTGYDFTRIAAKYEKDSVVQKNASDLLLTLLDIQREESVLDLGCGTGGVTNLIRLRTKGRVVGADVSVGMITQAREKYPNVEFRFLDALDLDYENEFDAIFANSSFQWFKQPKRALTRCLAALKPGGRMGIQAPATTNYCPAFVQAVKDVESDERTRITFGRFEYPWLFLENADQYRALFQDCGFEVPFAKIETVKSYHKPADAMKIFSSGAAAGYWNQAYYHVLINDSYIHLFSDIVLKSFENQAGPDGMVELLFNRIYLVGVKPSAGART